MYFFDTCTFCQKSRDEQKVDLIKLLICVFIFTVYPVSEGSIINTSTPIVVPTIPPKPVVVPTMPSTPAVVPTILSDKSVVPTLKSTPIVVPTVHTIATPSAQSSKQNEQTTEVQPPVMIATENLNESSTSLSAGGDSVLVQHYLLTSIVTNTSTGKQTSQLITQPILLPESDSTANQNMVLVPNLPVPVGIVPLNTPSGSTSVESTQSNAGDASMGVPVEILMPSNTASSAQTGVPVVVASSNNPVMESSSNLASTSLNGKGKVPARKSAKMPGDSFKDSGFTGEYVLLDDNQILVPDGLQSQTIIDYSSKGLQNQSILVQGHQNQSILVQGQGQGSQTVLDASCQMSDGMQDGKIMNVMSLTDLLTPIDIANFNDASSVDKDEMSDQSVDVRDFLSEVVSKELSDALDTGNSDVPIIENE